MTSSTGTGPQPQRPKVKVVSNHPDYFEFIRNLRNDPRVSDGFVQSGHVTAGQQETYMAEHADEYVVALIDGKPVGYGGSVDDDIRVCTHPDYQGLGIGRALIIEVMTRFPNSVAKIKVQNVASRRLFESCGFVPTFVLMEPAGRDEQDA